MGLCKDCFDIALEGGDAQVVERSWAVTNTNRIHTCHNHTPLALSISFELKLCFSAP